MTNLLNSIVYLALIIFGAQACLEDWNNQCKENNDCCSGYCERPPDWALGFCRVQVSSTPSVDPGNETCLPLWNEYCHNDVDCCSGYCWKGNPITWTEGVCKVTPCDQSACVLPNCSCSNAGIPGGLNSSEIPQIVFLTFDDAISEIRNSYYDQIFTSNRKNPNGARITGTFFVSHVNNHYANTYEWFDQGHEIALHSITHKLNYSYWANLDKDGWIEEVAVQIKMMEGFANIPAKEIVGFRCPFLQGSGDSTYQMLFDYGFLYDASRPTQMMMWPYTADYPSIQECVIPPCPTGLYEGLWECSLVELKQEDGNICVMADSCQTLPATAEETYEFLWNNFQNHYNGNRAPFGVHIHVSWFYSHDYILEGYLRFVDQMQLLPDVYIVSMKKGLDWIRNPVPLGGQLPESWNDRQRQYNCNTTYYCKYESPEELPSEIALDGPRNMTSCSPCPRKYPWTGNPLGKP